ncbi:MAG: hypothetical protein HOK21_22635 [Rhodospirillaceae bacterium]|jgi:hypothetical protein|nr:hypothetical protein [Rhodospirillaceae bacterium]MBT4691048.1 hypothetical protein [Rhodospirillaceae bacterium]MBT5079463.1 hypothetical protein [Rhodospirillaceae bacterium]MBT5526892.1 hypothetical protein [Rhodospirillaceae bacterium]MBT5878422.1 hypothetical protein [Rhodospirillaceae bacterium]
MFGKWNTRAERAVSPVLPGVVLHLSGPVLDQAFTSLQSDAEQYGGIERLLDALAAKATYFRSQLCGNALEHLSEYALYDLAAFMPSVRRRIAKTAADVGMVHMRQALRALLDDSQGPHDINERIAAFVQSFPMDRKHRWVRDLATEILHNISPGVYPLMSRWIWDAHANTGVLREIWHSEDGSVGRLDVPDDFKTHCNLRDELTGYCIDRGHGSDPEFLVDLLCAQIYAGYIGSQGASYLKTEFSGPDDAFQYTLRMLGLDVANARSRKTRVKLPEGDNSGQSERHRFTSFIELAAEGEA